ncbi:hypothetical protein GCM10010172_11530 [Paractinoplanes ferrugineus]|uniref:Uncharacterized protein n=1 Tax=Paractinoplanes ferrugineus TaxID=113564 RepID=A0A919IXF6_9ACTN|nr:hypothetical protein Afe05nite_15570 [Actinoplanes ferrugineus]
MGNVIRAMVLVGIAACVAAAALMLLRVRSRQRHPAPAASGASVAAEAPDAAFPPPRPRYDNSGRQNYRRIRAQSFLTDRL